MKKIYVEIFTNIKTLFSTILLIFYSVSIIFFARESQRIISSGEDIIFIGVFFLFIYVISLSADALLLKFKIEKETSIRHSLMEMKNLKPSVVNLDLSVGMGIYDFGVRIFANISGLIIYVSYILYAQPHFVMYMLLLIFLSYPLIRNRVKWRANAIKNVRNSRNILLDKFSESKDIYSKEIEKYSEVRKNLWLGDYSLGICVALLMACAFFIIWAIPPIGNKEYFSAVIVIIYLFSQLRMTFILVTVFQEDKRSMSEIIELLDDVR